MLERSLRLIMINHQIVARGDGQGRVNFEIIQAALRAGYAIDVISSRCAEEIAQHPRVRQHRIAVEHYPTQLLRNFVFAFLSMKVRKRLTVQRVMTHANGFITFGVADINAAHFVHSAWLDSNAYPYRWRRNPYDVYQKLFTTINAHLEQRAYATARMVVAVSNKVADELRAIGVPPEKIRVIYNGVDTDEFHPGDGDRARWGLPAEVPLFLFAGDIRTPRKGLDTVLRALAQVPDGHLAVAGDANRSAFPRMAQALGLATRVHFLGKVAEMPQLMQTADAFVLPSRYESMSLVVLEAMATALPVVTSCTVGAAELLGDGGLVLENPEDVHALAAAMRRLAEDAALRRRMGAAGRAIAERHTWAVMAESYLNLYAELGTQTDTATFAAVPMRPPVERH